MLSGIKVDKVEGNEDGSMTVHLSVPKERSLMPGITVPGIIVAGTVREKRRLRRFQRIAKKAMRSCLSPTVGMKNTPANKNNVIKTAHEALDRLRRTKGHLLPTIRYFDYD